MNFKLIQASFLYTTNNSQLRDVSSGQTLLLESGQLKSTEVHMLDKRVQPGHHVAYNDGKKWSEGVVVTASAVGVLQAR